jgi:transglutaminase-like putative cysteine protease
VLVSVLVFSLSGVGAETESVKIYEKELLGARTFEFTYRLTASDFPENAEIISIWIPMPVETEVQRVEEVTIDCDLPHKIMREPTYGNRLLYVEAAEGLPEKVNVDVTYLIRRQGYKATESMVLNDLRIRSTDMERFLQRDELVPIDGIIAERAKSALENAGDETLEKARALYDDVLRTMKYDKGGTGWGRGDALYACDVGTGNCTDFHSLFIGMARASGIPARFVIGFPLPPDKSEGSISGYHCWAEFYDEEFGWIPVDASEAWKHPEMREFLFGGLDPNRVEFTLGRDIQLVPEDKTSGEALNYLIYPYVLVDGQVHEVVVKEFGFRDTAG